MRALVIFTFTTLSSLASADVLPEPERPEFEHTPLPMPDVPELLILSTVIVLAAAGALIWKKKRRHQEA